MWPSPWSGTISSSKSFLGTGVSKDSLEPGLRGSWLGRMVGADQGWFWNRVGVRCNRVGLEAEKY